MTPRRSIRSSSSLNLGRTATGMRFVGWIVGCAPSFRTILHSPLNFPIPSKRSANSVNRSSDDSLRVKMHFISCNLRLATNPKIGVGASSTMKKVSSSLLPLLWEQKSWQVPSTGIFCPQKLVRIWRVGWICGLGLMLFSRDFVRMLA